jgi:hypothetical protein
MGFVRIFFDKTFLRRLTMNHRQKHLSACLIALAALFSTAPVWAATAPTLGTASNFAALGGAGVTCTSPFPPLPAITVTGNVGSLLLAPSSVTGFPGFTPGANECSLSGTVQLGASAAFADFMTAYAAIDVANPCPADAAHNLSGDLGGLTLSPGLYCISGVGLLSSQLTLDGGGNANAVWIFKAASSITPIGGSVVMSNGGNACNVYWRAGSAVSLDATTFVGNVLAGSAITFTGVGSSLAGRALAVTDVTMTGANISGNCSATQPPPPSCDKDHDGKGKDGKCNKDHDEDKDHHDNDKDKDHKDYSHNPWDSKDDHGSDKDHGGDK